MIDRHSKGSGVERATLTVLQVAGLAAVRVPLSGLAHAAVSGDAIMPLAGCELCCFQTTARTDGSRKLYDWLKDRDGLGGDQQAPLVIARLSMAATVLASSGKET